MTKRIQRRRTKGWRMPEGAIYVGRPSWWGNPFRVGQDGDAARCVHLYRLCVFAEEEREFDGLYRARPGERPGPKMVKSFLKGHDLVCWCPLDQPCHADVLLELANR